MFDLLEVFGEVGIDRLVRDYFAESPAILARKATLRHVTPAKMAGWHQDGAFMGAGIRSLNVWITLTGCGHDAPGLEVVGRRVDQLVPSRDGAHAAWGINAQDAEAFGGQDIEKPLFDAGDAMLFDHLLVHRTAFNAGMTRDRFAIETWLFRRRPMARCARATTTVTSRATRSRSCIERQRTLPRAPNRR